MKIILISTNYLGLEFRVLSFIDFLSLSIQVFLYHRISDLFFS